jgi:flagellar biosynthesis regulator FlaF
MEHPLIGNLQNLTAEELLEKITDLNKKLSIAYRMGNNDLCNQLRMAIESYQSKYQEKIRQGTDKNFDDIIDVS